MKEILTYYLKLLVKKLMISTNKVDSKEILQSGKGGLLFRVGDSNELFKLLKKLNVNSKENKKRINTSFDFVINNYQKIFLFKIN